MEYGIVSLLPTALVLILAVITQRTLESVIAGAIFAFILMDGTGFVDTLAEVSLDVLRDKDIAWIILVCALYGVFIALLVRSGGSMAFGNLLLKRLRSKGQSLFATWVLGLFIFLDDYLNSLTVGATMKAVTDRFKTSRAMLAYVIDSTAAPLCLLVPISSWGAYFAGLLEKNAVAADGQGLSLFIESIPYMFYPLVAVMLVPLVASGFIPRIGPMLKAEELAEATGDLGATDGDAVEMEFGNGGPSTFFLPIFALLFFTVFPSVDLLRGVIAGILVTVVYFASLRLMPLSELFDTCTNGIKIMVPVLAMLLALFVFVEANDRIGLTEYVIQAVKPYMNATMLPVIVFVTMAAVSFATGSNWGVIAIAMPVAFPLAQAYDVSIPLVIGALLSASGFGSHACFYSDSTVLSAQGAGCNTYQHAVTQLPYALIAAGIAAAGFLFAAV
ncbi:MAG: Na+/H+ antiporter NhaC family protein [Pseudomonadota bacterium]|nr:Na+/H+ antiporter NhaC family protein [Pseudomonadota bacterium]